MSEHIVSTEKFFPKMPDLVEVVRCRDCAHFRETRMYDGSTGRRCSGVMAFIEPNPDGFCAWGERHD